MVRAKTENMVRRWKEQRWLMDSVIQAVGMKWDQPRLGYRAALTGKPPRRRRVRRAMPEAGPVPRAPCRTR